MLSILAIFYSISTVIENNCCCALLSISVYCALSLNVVFSGHIVECIYYKVQLRTWESTLQCNCLFANTNFCVHSFLLFNVLVFLFKFMKSCAD